MSQKFRILFKTYSGAVRESVIGVLQGEFPSEGEARDVIDKYTPSTDKGYYIVEPIPTVTKPYYLVYRVGGDAPKKRHSTFEEAREEARRLSALEFGEFVVLESRFSVSLRNIPKVEESYYGR